MEKVTVYFKPEVIGYLNALVLQLYESDYFGFMQSAIDYKNKLIDYIEDNIANFPYKNSPLDVIHFGSFYMFYKSNKRTTWYVFFEKKGNTYLVTQISNNHQSIAKFL